MQIVEIRPEEERFLRLLEILGEWYEKGKIIIFVASQVSAGGAFVHVARSCPVCNRRPMAVEHHFSK
jgi:ATP-dependent RNA helicase DDX46/PRP5